MAAARARLVTALVALGFVAAVWLGGDGGGARAALGQATGPLVTIAPGDAAVLVAQGLVPGVTRTGEVTVTNVGDSAGAFALSAGDLVDSVAPLSDVLALAVDEVTPGGAAAPVFSGRLDALSGVALGTLGQGEARRYRFAVSFPSGRPDAVDNAYQGASTAVTFVWSTSSAEAPPTVAPPQGANATDTRTPAISVSGITVGCGSCARGDRAAARVARRARRGSADHRSPAPHRQVGRACGRRAPHRPRDSCGPLATTGASPCPCAATIHTVQDGFRIPAHMPSELIDVCPLSELPPGAVRVVEWEDLEIGIFNCNGELLAIEDRCSHDNGNLFEGDVDPDKCTVECPRHGSLFDLHTGKPLTLPAYVPVDTFPVVVQDDLVKVEVE
jgi:3-phenylpropionate/trans-cinnamate dioxygenase ferredoxin component